MPDTAKKLNRTPVKQFEVVHGPGAVPLAVKLLYWVDAITGLVIDAPLFGIRALQKYLLPERVLTPELRLIAQGKGLSHAFQVGLLWYIGTSYAPDTTLGKLCAWATTLYHLISTYLIVAHGVLEANAFQHPGNAVSYHSLLTLLGAYAVYRAHFHMGSRKTEASYDGDIRHISSRAYEGDQTSALSEPAEKKARTRRAKH